MTLSLSPSCTQGSHREAPLITNDPLANTDCMLSEALDNPNTNPILNNYIPLAELPHMVVPIYTFGENIRYEIHIDNDASKKGDEIIYRFEFKK